jgi:hypothetical protein
MLAQDSVLVMLVKLVDRIPVPAPPPHRRGHPRVYSDRLFLKGAGHQDRATLGTRA